MIWVETQLSGQAMQLDKLEPLVTEVESLRANHVGESNGAGRMYETNVALFSAPNILSSVEIVKRIRDDQESGAVEDVVLTLNYEYKDQCNLEFAKIELAALCQVGATLCVTCFEEIGEHSKTKMVEHAKIKLSRLREIGWSLWDPIGLRGLSDGEWQDGGSCADEYDSYMLQVAGRLRRGEPTAEVVAYLEDTETGHIGLSHNATTRSRAEATVAAIAWYLTTLPKEPLKVR